MKTCTACREPKPLDEFHRNKRSSDGRHSRCKPCAIAAVRASQRKNPEAKRATDRAWRERNPGAWREWRATNAGKERERHRKQRERWSQQNAGRVLSDDMTKRCPKCGRTLPETDFYLKRNTASGLSPYCRGCCSNAIRRACERAHGPAYGQICHLCGDEIHIAADADADHLTPRSKGGSDKGSNLRWAHSTCNRSRGNRPLTPIQRKRAGV